VSCNVVLVVQVLKIRDFLLIRVGLVNSINSGVWDFSWAFEALTSSRRSGVGRDKLTGFDGDAVPLKGPTARQTKILADIKGVRVQRLRNRAERKLKCAISECGVADHAQVLFK
jgi:hypothetical protein